MSITLTTTTHWCFYFFKLFLGIFFQVKSVALIEDVDDVRDYKKTSRFVLY